MGECEGTKLINLLIMFEDKASSANDFQGALCGVLGSMIGMFWIITGAQYLIKQGELKYSILPVTTDSCDVFLPNVTTIASILM